MRQHTRPSLGRDVANSHMKWEVNTQLYREQTNPVHSNTLFWVIRAVALAVFDVSCQTYMHASMLLHVWASYTSYHVICRGRAYKKKISVAHPQDLYAMPRSVSPPPWGDRMCIMAGLICECNNDGCVRTWLSTCVDGHGVRMLQWYVETVPHIGTWVPWSPDLCL